MSRPLVNESASRRGVYTNVLVVVDEKIPAAAVRAAISEAAEKALKRYPDDPAPIPEGQLTLSSSES